MSRATGTALRLHVGLALAELFCVSAFVFELSRAIGGNSLSWAYVFEWPLFGGYAVYMWRRMLRDEHQGPTRPVFDEQDDPELVAWNRYLASAHETSHDESHDSKEE